MLDHYLTIALASLQQQAHENPGNVSRPLPLLAHLLWNTRQDPGRLINVLGMVQGEDPILRDEIIVIGAHRDHFGEQAGLTFPGADDNASGTAVMLEVASHFTKEGKRPKRSILFVSFDGEERGLLGSRHYVNNPALPLVRTVAMINLDHVGVGNGTLTVGITRLNKSIAQQAAIQAGVKEKIKLYGYFPGGDHVPFYEMKVPTITVVSAGVHPHFHQTSDTADTINQDVVMTATQFVFSLLDILANPP
jgi:Zn-dependent M28 family amino/carboxypeptidase